MDSLSNGKWRCVNCAMEHGWPMDLAAFAPDPWQGEQSNEPNSALRMEGDFLSEDFCVLAGRHFMIRAVLDIPVRGLAEPFGFGCWSTLSRKNFETYVDGFDRSDYADCGPWTGWLCNRLADYIGADPEAVYVDPQPNRKRPTLRIIDANHQLAVDQDEGIPADRMIEILRFYGHAPQD